MVLNINTREIRDVTIVDLAGELIRVPDAEAPTLHRLVKAELEKGKRKIILDCQDLEFLDSFGLGEMIASYISTLHSGGKLKFAGMPRKIRKIFEAAVITPPWYYQDADCRYDTMEAALESFGQPGREA